LEQACWTLRGTKSWTDYSKPDRDCSPDLQQKQAIAVTETAAERCS